MEEVRERETWVAVWMGEGPEEAGATAAAARMVVAAMVRVGAVMAVEAMGKAGVETAKVVVMLVVG